MIERAMPTAGKQKSQMSTRNAWKKQESVQQLEAAVDRMYGAKYPKIVTSNKGELPGASQNLNKVEYLESWGSAFDTEVSLKNANPSRTKYSRSPDEFSEVFLKSLDTRSGNALPVSSFKPGGETPIGQSEFQKRGLADEVPEWIPDACTQCNLCSIAVPPFFWWLWRSFGR